MATDVYWCLYMPCTRTCTCVNFYIRNEREGGITRTSNLWFLQIIAYGNLPMLKWLMWLRKLVMITDVCWCLLMLLTRTCLCVNSLECKKRWYHTDFEPVLSTDHSIRACTYARITPWSVPARSNACLFAFSSGSMHWMQRQTSVTNTYVKKRRP